MQKKDKREREDLPLTKNNAVFTSALLEITLLQFVIKTVLRKSNTKP